MKEIKDIAKYVRHSKYASYLNLEQLEKYFKPIVGSLNEEERVKVAFVATIYGVPKRFVALTRERIIIYSIEKNPHKKGLKYYDFIDGAQVELADKERGFIRFYIEGGYITVKVEPKYTREITRRCKRIFK